MAQICMFPVKKKLPKGVEERFNEIAKEYVEALFATLTIMSVDDQSPENLDEIHKLIADVYAEALVKAVDELAEP